MDHRYLKFLFLNFPASKYCQFALIFFQFRLCCFYKVCSYKKVQYSEEKYHWQLPYEKNSFQIRFQFSSNAFQICFRCVSNSIQSHLKSALRPVISMLIFQLLLIFTHVLIFQLIRIGISITMRTECGLFCKDLEKTKIANTSNINFSLMACKISLFLKKRKKRMKQQRKRKTGFRIGLI